MLFYVHTKLSLHWLLYVLSVLNKVLCVDCWVLLFWVLTWFTAVCSQVGVWWNVVCSVFVLLLDWFLHVFMSKWSSSLLLPCFCYVFVSAVISADAVATTATVLLPLKVTVFPLLPFSSYFHQCRCFCPISATKQKHRIAVAVTQVDCCVWVM